jgi:hypothetical protein
MILSIACLVDYFVSSIVKTQERDQTLSHHILKADFKHRLELSVCPHTFRQGTIEDQGKSLNKELIAVACEFLYYRIANDL